MKKICMIFCLLLISTLSFAQWGGNPQGGPGGSPAPQQGPGGYHPGWDNPNNPHQGQGPIGTATVLMLGMGGCYLGYKLKKNKKDL